MQNELTDKQRAIIEKVEKLLAVRTDRGATEEEAATAANLAMKLLEAHNLDVSAIERSGSAAKGKRQDTKMSGGLYQWQRDLWKAVAELNFCMYFSIRGLGKGSKYEHRVLGRQENVLATKIMAGYLEQVINRMAKQKGQDLYPGKSVFISELIGYREGIASTLARRLTGLRDERKAESQRRAQEQAAAARHPSAAPGTGLVLASMIQDEEDLNNDFFYGLEPGTTSARRAKSKADTDAWYAEYNRKAEAEAVRKQKEADEWKARDPVGFAKAQAAAWAKEAKESERYWKNEARKEARRKTSVTVEREYTDKDWLRDLGRSDGHSINLDQQIDKEAQEKLS